MMYIIAIVLSSYLFSKYQTTMYIEATIINEIKILFKDIFIKLSVTEKATK